MLVEGGLELLDENQAWELLSTGDVGRIGVSMGAMPAIFPVNYAIVDRTIVFLSAPGSKLTAAAKGSVVAFEVDDYERRDRSGWSVLVVGRSEIVDGPESTVQALSACLEPWVDTDNKSVVRIWPSFLSGRRIIH